jgi:hypothetical protein
MTEVTEPNPFFGVISNHSLIIMVKRIFEIVLSFIKKNRPAYRGLKEYGEIMWEVAQINMTGPPANVE